MLCARSKDELCPSPEHVFLPETHEAFARQLEAIADGEIDVTVETAIRTLTGERRDVVVRIRFPEEGEPFDRVPMSLVDITARKRGERALSLLAQTSVVLAESVHAGETLQRVAQLAVPAIADWMSISLRNDEDRIELVATAHVEGEDEPLIREHFERGRGRETSV